MIIEEPTEERDQNLRVGDTVVIVKPYYGEEHLVHHTFILTIDNYTEYGCVVRSLRDGEERYMHWSQIAPAMKLPGDDDE